MLRVTILILPFPGPCPLLRSAPPPLSPAQDGQVRKLTGSCSAYVLMEQAFPGLLSICFVSHSLLLERKTLIWGHLVLGFSECLRCTGQLENDRVLQVDLGAA